MSLNDSLTSNDVLEIMYSELDELAETEKLSDNCAPTTADNRTGAEDDDDDDDDSVNIIIDDESLKNKAMLYSSVCSKTNKLTKAEHDHLFSNEISLHSEIQTLARSLFDKKQCKTNDNDAANSAATNNNNKIVIVAENIPIPISANTELSTRLREHIWGVETYNYKPFELRQRDLFNTVIREMVKDKKYPDYGEYVAFFAAIYNKFSSTTPQNRHKHNTANRQSTSTGPKPLLFYHEFTLMILRNGEFVDAAIHSMHNSVNGLIEKYKPTKIFCIGHEGDPLSDFINYKWQPFHATLRDRITYIGDRFTNTPNKIVFCSRNSIYCSFCRCVDTIFSYYKFFDWNNLKAVVLSRSSRYESDRDRRHKIDKCHSVKSLRQLIEDRKRRRRYVKRLSNIRPISGLGIIELRSVKKFTNSRPIYNIKNVRY